VASQISSRPPTRFSRGVARTEHRDAQPSTAPAIATALLIKTEYARTSAPFLMSAKIMSRSYPSESHQGSSLMRLFVTCVLVIGPAVLLVVGFLSVVRDLLSSSDFAATMSPNELEQRDGRIDNATDPEWVVSFADAGSASTFRGKDVGAPGK
jgi:hypothetical protein